MSDSEEERLLEENLFGKDFVRKRRREVKSGEDGDEDPESGVPDDQLFFFDAPGLDLPSQVSSSVVWTSKKPLWSDPTDSTITVSLTSHALLRKLRQSETDDVVSGTEYEKRLRKQFEKNNPKPSWVDDARKRKRGEAESDDEDEVWEELMDGREKKRKGALPEGRIEMERVRDLNQQAYSTGDIKRVEFHNIAPIAYTASSDRRLRVFQADGVQNALLSTVHFPSLNLTHASFSPSGSQIYLSGKQPSIMSYDLAKDVVTASPPSMFAGALGGGKRETDSRSIDLFRVGGEKGNLMAITGKGGYVHLVDTRGWSIVGDLKVPDNNMVKDFIWARQGKELWVLNGGKDQEIFVFDVAERRARDKWRDSGGFSAVKLAMDHSERWLGVSSKTGISIGNLTTPTTMLSFHPSSSILAMASEEKKGALRLLHLPSLTVFENWPRKDTPVGRVKDVAFDGDGKWMSVAGGLRAGMWRLKWFGAQS
ncbi:WD40 repeat-like protein [Atractiella rhizophila]|nr:WD40 repeat-like protein [Atractiella rhizophila]